MQNRYNYRRLQYDIPDTEEPLRHKYQSYKQIAAYPKQNTSPGNNLFGTNTRSSFLRVSAGVVKHCRVIWNEGTGLSLMLYTTDIISGEKINQFNLRNTFHRTRSVRVKNPVKTGH